MTTPRQTVHFGGFGEQLYGYAQAVKAGDTVYVAGQTASNDDGSTHGEGDMAAQMETAYANVARVLSDCGATMADVVDEILFVTDVRAAATVGLEVRTRAYGGTPEVASTLIGVSALAIPSLMIEIKVTAKV